MREITDEADLTAAIAEGQGTGRQLVTLGSGTNIVLGEYLDAIVLLMRTRGVSLTVDGDARLLTAAAGEHWHDLVRFCLASGAFGIENLALIPGRVGAAPIQNIGAYGLELSDVFESLEAFHRDTGERKRFDREACGFGYRSSLFKRGADNPWIIWQVTLALRGSAAPRNDYRDLARELKRLGFDLQSATPADIAEAVIRVRRRKLPDPRRIANVGSFFKNPIVNTETVGALRTRLADLVAWPLANSSDVKLSAAQLIDRAGLKRCAEGGARVWYRQPLVLVNERIQTRREFLRLAVRVQAEVQERWGVALEFEPDFLPALD